MKRFFTILKLNGGITSLLFCFGFALFSVNLSSAQTPHHNNNSLIPNRPNTPYQPPKIFKPGIKGIDPFPIMGFKSTFPNSHNNTKPWTPTNQASHKPISPHIQNNTKPWTSTKLPAHKPISPHIQNNPKPFTLTNPAAHKPFSPHIQNIPKPFTPTNPAAHKPFSPHIQNNPKPWTPTNLFTHSIKPIQNTDLLSKDVARLQKQTREIQLNHQLEREKLLKTVKENQKRLNEINGSAKKHLEKNIQKTLDKIELDRKEHLKIIEGNRKTMEDLRKPYNRVLYPSLKTERKWPSTFNNSNKTKGTGINSPLFPDGRVVRSIRQGGLPLTKEHKKMLNPNYKDSKSTDLKTLKEMKRKEALERIKKIKEIQRENWMNASPEWNTDFIVDQMWSPEFDEMLENIIYVNDRLRKINSRPTIGGREKGHRLLKEYMEVIRWDFLRVIGNFARSSQDWDKFKRLAYKYPNKWESKDKKLNILSQEAMLLGPIPLYQLLFESAVGDRSVVNKPPLLAQKGNRWSSIHINLDKKPNSKWVKFIWPIEYYDLRTEKHVYRPGELLKNIFGGNFDYKL